MKSKNGESALEAVAPMSCALAVTPGVAPSGFGATAAAARAATTALKRVVFISLRAGVRVRKQTKI